MAFVESKGARISYEVIDLTAPWVGEPQTVIFNHGIGIDHRMWTKWLPALIERYRLVLLDMRGFGASSIPPADARWSMDLLVGDVFAVARAVNAERFHIVGESMGGTVALCSYFHDPKAIRTITVSNGAHIGATLKNLNDWRDVIRERGMAGWSAMMSAHRFYDDGLEPRERALQEAHLALRGSNTRPPGVLRAHPVAGGGDQAGGGLDRVALEAADAGVELIVVE